MDYNAKTVFYFLLGNPVDHSLSPILQNAGFKALGINATYLAAKVLPPDLESAIKGLRALSAGGCNVTSPHKEAIIPYLDSVSNEARIINSVNTVVNKKGKLKGASTDGEGFYRAVLNAAPAYDIKKPALIIGAGGAARAIAFTLALHGLSELYLANRTLNKAKAVAEIILKNTSLNSCHTLALSGSKIQEAFTACRLIVYCPPVDADEIKTAFTVSGTLKKDTLFFDLRYSPTETGMMKAAAGAGAKTYNGLELLFQQALLSFTLFTGREAPAEAMKEALNQSLEKED